MATQAPEGPIEHPPHELGKIYKASGRTIGRHPGRNDYCILDWALIDLYGKTLKEMSEKSGRDKLRPNFHFHLDADEVSREHL